MHRSTTARFGALARASALALAAALASGCAALPAVQPWEKGELAKPAMQFDADPLAAKFAEHIYSSKEGAAGGSGVGGGGCGCN